MPESPPGPEPDEMPRAETPTPELSGNLSERLEQLRSEMSSALETAADRAVGELLAAIATIDGAGTQEEILQALLESGTRFASRTAFFLTRPDRIRGWASHRFGRGGDAVGDLELGYEDGAWAELGRGAGAVRMTGEECAALSARVKAEPGADGLLVPFVLRGQLGGALYADRLPGDVALGSASLQLLTHAAAQALETMAFRDGVSPALRFNDESTAETAGLAIWEEKPEPSDAVPAVAERVAEEEELEEAVAEEEPAAAEEAVAVAEKEVAAAAPEPVLEKGDAEPSPVTDVAEPREEEFGEAPEPELEDTNADIWALEDDDESTHPGIAPPPAPEPPAMPIELATGAVGQETVRLDVTALQGQQPAVAPPPVGQDFQPPAEPLPEVAEPKIEPKPEPPEPGADLDDTEQPTVISQRPAVEEPAPPETVPQAAGFVPSAPVEEPRPAPPPSPASQVAPPSDLTGPGSAFAKDETPEVVTDHEEALHEEARRLARLLVSEIKLYNEEIIEEGRRNGDIYERLKDDIDRSGQMYKERIDPRLQGKENYFRQELVQRLAGGDEGLLGM